MNRTWRRFLLSILVLLGLSISPIGPPAGHAAPGSAVPAEPITVYLHTTVLLEGQDYTLGQVASVYSPDLAKSQALRQLPLGPIPARPTLLPARAIQERIAAVAGDAVVIGGRVAVLPGKTIPEDQLWFYAALLAFVESQDTYKQGRIEIELLNSPLLLEGFGDATAEEQGMASGWEDRIVFDTGRFPYSAGFRSSVSSNNIPAGTMRVTYRILAASDGNAAVRLIPSDPKSSGLMSSDPLSSDRNLEGSFRLWIHHFLPIARAAVDLPANQSLTEEVVIFSEEDISLLRSTFVVQGEEIGNYKTVASIRRGERIEGERLQRVLAVRAGDRVMITFARPGLLISLPGRAFRSGSVGDVIDVRPEATAGRFQARITSKGKVIVESY